MGEAARGRAGPEHRATKGRVARGMAAAGNQAAEGRELGMKAAGSQSRSHYRRAEAGHMGWEASGQ